MDADSQLIEAVSNGMLDVCMQLLNGREKICDRDGNNLVAIAAMNGHEPTLWYLASHQIDLHHKNFRGQIPLDVATENCKQYLKTRMLQENEGWMYHFLYGVLTLDKDNAEGWLCDIGLTYDSMRIFVAECANLSNRWAFREYHCGSVVVKTPPASNHIPKESDPLAYSRRRLKTKLMRLGLMTTFTDSRVDDALRSCHLNVERAADELLNSM